MKPIDRETWLELGILALLVSILGGVGMLLYGQAAGGASRSSNRQQSAPQPGSIQPKNQGNVTSNAAR